MTKLSLKKVEREREREKKREKRIEERKEKEKKKNIYIYIWCITEVVMSSVLVINFATVSLLLLYLASYI